MEDIQELGMVQEQPKAVEDEATGPQPVDELMLQTQMAEVDKSWLAIGKQVFIIVKTLVIVGITLHAAWKWRKSTHPMRKSAQMCLLFSAFVAIGVSVYKFTTKAIAPLFLLQVISHYSVFCVLHVLVAFAKNHKSKETQQKKLISAMWPFHLMYLVIMGVGFKASSCDQNKQYPDSFMLSNSLFFGIYIMALSLHKKEYTLEWGDSEEKAKKLFLAQTERFIQSYTFLVEWHAFEMVLAKVLDVMTDSIHCSSDGNHWFYSSARGNLFMMIHLIGISLAGGLTRAVFIKTAKPSGIFGGLEEEDQLDDLKKVKDSKKTQ